MIVYVCSPYHAKDEEELQKHINYAQKLTRAELLAGNQPITVHLYMTQCLDDNSSIERLIGLEAGLEILKVCQEMVVGAKFGISEGMHQEIETAQSQGVRVRYSCQV